MSYHADVFPDYLTQVCDLLSKSSLTSDVNIVLDAPDHGSLHAYLRHRKYVDTVKKAATLRNGTRAKVRLLLPYKWKLVSDANPYNFIGKNYRLLLKTFEFMEFAELVNYPVKNDPELCIKGYMLFVATEFMRAGVIIKRSNQISNSRPKLWWQVKSGAIYVPKTFVANPAVAHRTSEKETLEKLSNKFSYYWKLGTPFDINVLNTYANSLFRRRNSSSR